MIDETEVAKSLLYGVKEFVEMFVIDIDRFSEDVCQTQEDCDVIQKFIDGPVNMFMLRLSSPLVGAEMAEEAEEFLREGGK